MWLLENLKLNLWPHFVLTGQHSSRSQSHTPMGIDFEVDLRRRGRWRHFRQTSENSGIDTGNDRLSRNGSWKSGGNKVAKGPENPTGKY